MPRQPDAPANCATRLRQLQRDLQHYVLSDHGALGGHCALADAIVDAPPLPMPARLGIYRNAYRVRLIEALDSTYPALHKVLGDEMFVSLAEMFIAAHPSVYRSIRWYGRELGAFLLRCPPFAEQPILSEVAQFEWTLAEIFDAPDAPVLEREALRAIAPDAWAELKFGFHPSLRRLQLAWNTAIVWRAVSGDEAPPQPELAPQPVHWLLWRQHFKNYFRSMDAIEAAALDTALQGNSFAEICAALTARLRAAEVPLCVATLVGNWVDSGIISFVSR